MFAFSVQHKLKILGTALVVPLSLFLTLTAVLDLPPVQASHHTAVMPLASNDPSSRPVSSRLPTDPSAPSAGIDIAISGFAFNPAVVTITVGTVVTWTNSDAAPHTSTSDVGSADPWNSGTLAQGATFTRTFNMPGVYGYHCGIHPSMLGTIVVLAAQPQQAPLSVSVAGPRGGVADVTHAFTATVSPITTTQPITYFWQATGQTPVTRTGQGLSDTLAFTWTNTNLGQQVITVTAQNVAGSVSTAYTITIVPPAGVGVTDVSIVDFAFQPQVITISVGSTVRWINTGVQAHTSTSAVSSSEVWDSGILDPGEVFTRTFNTPGTFDYLCTFHPSMQGTVVVLGTQPQQAPLELSITGPSGGVADVTHAFTATVSPITTTQPITYFWQATGQTPVTRTDKGLSDTLAFTWTAANLGQQVITVTAQNVAGSVSTAYTITIVPLPSAGVTDVSIVDFAFQPQVITISVGSIVRWTNIGLQAHTSTSAGSSSEVWDSGILDPGEVFTRTFNTPGTFDYLCTLHLSMQGTVVVLGTQPQQAPLSMSITGPSGGVADVTHAFTATVSPITTTQPITYFWQATGQTPVTRTDKGVSDTLAFTWSAANVGPQVITVTAQNVAGSVSATYAITVVPPVDTDITDVSIVDFAFNPSVITISVGSTVRWTNTGLQAHTSTSAVGSPETWDSGTLNPGGVFTRTFNAPGVYDYRCAIHTSMRGTVVVLAHVYLPLVLR